MSDTSHKKSKKLKKRKHRERDEERHHGDTEIVTVDADSGLSQMEECSPKKSKKRRRELEETSAQCHGSGDDQECSPKKSKKRRRELEETSAQCHGSGDDQECSPKKSKKRRRELEETSAQCHGSGDDQDVNEAEKWTSDEIHDLISAVKDQVSDENQLRRSVFSKIDWDAIHVSTHTPQSCQEELKFIISLVRKERSMIEILNAADALVAKGNLKKQLAERPKRPHTMYFRYYTSQLNSLRNKHPDLPFKELKQLISVNYRELSHKKKAKLKAACQEDNDEYSKAIVKWYEKHPEFVKEQAKSTNNTKKTKGPLRIITAKELYIEAMKEKHGKEPVEWKELKDKKKRKYFNMAIQAKREYDKALESYMVDHPEYKPKMVTIGFLNKNEWEIRDRLMKKPKKPASNSWFLFISEYAGPLSDNSARKVELKEQWTNLSDDERQMYRKRAKEAQEQYLVLMANYLRDLSPEERSLCDEHRLALLSKKSSKNHRSSQETGVLVYMAEKSCLYQRIHSDLDKEMLQKLMQNDYNALSDTLKADYEERAQQPPSKSCMNQEEKRGTQFPGAPVRPISHTYNLFCQKQLQKCNGIPAKERMMYCARKWADADKAKYKRKKQKHMQHYYEEVGQYLKTLSDADAKAYLKEYNIKQFELERNEAGLGISNHQSASSTTSGTGRESKSFSITGQKTKMEILELTSDDESFHGSESEGASSHKSTSDILPLQSSSSSLSSSDEVMVVDEKSHVFAQRNPAKRLLSDLKQRSPTKILFSSRSSSDEESQPPKPVMSKKKMPIIRKMANVSLSQPSSSDSPDSDTEGASSHKSTSDVLPLQSNSSSLSSSDEVMVGDEKSHVFAQRNPAKKLLLDLKQRSPTKILFSSSSSSDEESQSLKPVISKKKLPIIRKMANVSLSQPSSSDSSDSDTEESLVLRRKQPSANHMTVKKKTVVTRVNESSSSSSSDSEIPPTQSGSVSAKQFRTMVEVNNLASTHKPVSSSSESSSSDSD